MRCIEIGNDGGSASHESRLIETWDVLKSIYYTTT